MPDDDDLFERMRADYQATVQELAEELDLDAGVEDALARGGMVSDGGSTSRERPGGAR